MNQIGFVKEVKGDKASVMFKRLSECGDKCSTCSCHCEAPPLTLDMNNPVDAKAGDTVEVAMKDSIFLKFTFFAYIIPLILMLLGIAIGYSTTHNELTSALLGFAFLAISYVILRFINNNHKKESFHMVRIISKEELARFGL
jgi:sigma-E factor negative regulatory protein RseC